MKRHESIKWSMTERKLSYLVGFTPIKRLDIPRSAFFHFQKPITWWDIHFGITTNQKTMFSTRFGGTYTQHSRRPIRGWDACGHLTHCRWDIHTIRLTNQNRRFHRWQLFAACRCCKTVGVECKALGGTLAQMVSWSISGILHYV